MILVTGATGYLGSKVSLELLSRNIPIRALKRRGSTIPSFLENQDEKVEWIEADLCDIYTLTEVMSDIDQVIHCASARFDPNLNSQESLRADIQGTANLVNISLDYSIRKFIYISCSVTLGDLDSLSDEPVSLLNDFNNQRIPHLYAKIESEKEVWRGIMEGLPGLILNPGLILSHWKDAHKNPHLKNLYEWGSQYFFVQEFGIIWIQDLIQTLLNALNSEREGEQWLLTSENIRSFDLIQKINEKIGKENPKREFKPSFWRIPGLQESSTEFQSKSGIRELFKMVQGMPSLKPISGNPFMGKSFKPFNELF